ncbi:uncharacterized protein [Dermacentor andersoni]|uniref:uncharacterized protein n=1 Tax=Dermacentor andersoni TaxID=34620 RepID=UPI0024167702|nr:uncharacterized protein LOC126543002 isoform X2 [Dermacentor andersoni]
MTQKPRASKRRLLRFGMAHVCDRAAIGDDDRRCEFCSKLLIQRKNMLQHIRNVHKMAVDVKKLMKCDVCGTSLPTMEKYSVHQIAAHNFEADYVHLVFRNNKEFHEWKAEEEGSQNCWLILPRDPKKLASGETRIHYYCNRSVCKHIHCVVIANTTSSNKAHESSPEEACEILCYEMRRCKIKTPCRFHNAFKKPRKAWR